MQVKAFLRNEPLPFTAGQLEGMSSMVNMNTRIAKKLFSSSLRYWMLEYMRRQPKERRFAALILRFIKDRIAALFLIEVLHQMPLVPYTIKITTSFPSNIVSRFSPYYLTCILRTLGFWCYRWPSVTLQVGLHSSAWVSLGKQIGDEVDVRVEESHPRDDILSLKEVD